jgi:hypothetical protein
MPKYITDVARWISHENRMVAAGETFETEFPKGMKLSDTLREVRETLKVPSKDMKSVE